MASAILFPLALKSGGFPLEASDYSAIFGLPWISLHFKLLFGLGICGFQSKNGSKTQNKDGEEIEQASQTWLLDTLFAVPSVLKTIVDPWLQR
ncbi:hypothetical protein C1H46_022385 [Malus baccata]|uniref:Uncharacterized protein n=1 Tax=Malus baccata TaxID=106549 RepID=A0A540LZX7_MALBA|nr:hypothetical protein C1H46_022385 [Malus baccata]